MGRGIKFSGAFFGLLVGLALCLGGCGNGQPYNPLTDTSTDFGDFGSAGLEPPIALNQVFALYIAGVNCDPQFPGVRAIIRLEGGVATWKDLCLGSEVQLEDSDYIASHQNLGVVYGGYLYLNRTVTRPQVACAFTGFNLVVIDQTDEGLVFHGGFEGGDPSFSGVQSQYTGSGGILSYQKPDSGLIQLQVPVSSPNQSYLDLDHAFLEYTGSATCMVY